MNFIFLDEFTDPMTELQSKYNIITLGDFNLHANDPQDADASIFLGTLMGMGFTQHIDIPTHNSANTLDLIITEILSLLKVVKYILGPFTSDYAVVECYLSLKRKTCSGKS